MFSKHVKYLPAILELLSKYSNNNRLLKTSIPFANLTNKVFLKSKDYMWSYPPPSVFQLTLFLTGKCSAELQRTDT